jgi:hypothetical protein
MSVEVGGIQNQKRILFRKYAHDLGLLIIMPVLLRPKLRGERWSMGWFSTLILG